MDTYKKFNELTEEFIYFLYDRLTNQNDIDLLQKLNMDLTDLKNANYTAPLLLFYKSVYLIYGKDLENDINKIEDISYIDKIKKSVNEDKIITPLIKLVKSYPKEVKKMIISGMDICREESKLEKKKIGKN